MLSDEDITLNPYCFYTMYHCHIFFLEKNQMHLRARYYFAFSFLSLSPSHLCVFEVTASDLSVVAWLVVYL